MSIDLDSSEGRKKYLSEKLDDLLDGINESYGTLLMEELLSRLELTVKDFNNEMKDLCDNLIAKEKERQQLLELLKNSNNTPSIASDPMLNTNNEDVNSESETKEISNLEIDEDAPEWEKKLAKLERK